MDIEKLIEQLHIADAGNPGNIFDEAATDLSTLKAEVEFWKYRCNESVSHASELDIALYDTEAENEKLRAELEQVKQERDAAISSWRGFCVKCDWNGKQYLGDGQMDARCRTGRENGKCNWHWREQKED